MDPQMMSLITFQSRAARQFHNAASLVPSCRLFAALSVPRFESCVTPHTRLKHLPGFITRCAIEACVQQFEHNNNNVAKRHKLHKMYQSEKPKSSKDVFSLRSGGSAQERQPLFEHHLAFHLEKALL